MSVYEIEPRLVDDEPAARLRAVCHDLRQPVAAILAMVSAARGATLTPGGVDRWLDGIEAQAEWLASLARSELAGAEAGAESLVEAQSLVELDGLVAEVAGTVARGSGRAVELTRCKLPVWVQGDRVQLSRAVLNVVENAVRAAGPTGRTLVRVAAGDGRATVEVDDDGPGFALIPPGTGLGLRIARRALAASGGGLAVSPSRLGGACVRLVLPLARHGLGTSS